MPSYNAYAAPSVSMVTISRHQFKHTCRLRSASIPIAIATEIEQENLPSEGEGQAWVKAGEIGLGEGNQTIETGIHC